MSDDQKHVWQKGDVCTCEYQGIAGGVLYVVIDVLDREEVGAEMLKIKPIYGLFQDIKGRKTRNIGAGWCTPRDLVALGCEYAKLGHFIAELAHRRSE
jgi:hypothetical protein